MRDSLNFMTPEAIAYYAAKFFPHLTPACGQGCVVAVMLNPKSVTYKTTPEMRALPLLGNYTPPPQPWTRR